MRLCKTKLVNTLGFVDRSVCQPLLVTYDLRPADVPPQALSFLTHFSLFELILERKDIQYPHCMRGFSSVQLRSAEKELGGVPNLRQGSIRKPQSPHLVSYPTKFRPLQTSIAKTMAWQTFPISAAPKLSLKSQISCTSRNAEHLELFYITEDGAIVDCTWSSQSPLAGYPIAPPGSEAVGAAITSLTRANYHLEVFWMGPEGSVEAAFWYTGSSWQRYQLAKPNSADLDSQLASISLFDKKMEVWWTKDGGIRGAFWLDNNKDLTLYY